MKLTNIAIKQALPQAKSYKLPDGRGLYLLVHANGSKYWRLKYRYLGKEKLLSFGVYPSITLAKARQLTEVAKQQLANGEDPSQVKKEMASANAEAVKNNFETLARDWWEYQRSAWSESHASRTLQQMERDLFPTLGNMAISDIRPRHIKATVQAIEARGARDVAGRMLQRCSAVFRYGIQEDRAEINPAADMSSVLKPKPKVKHRAAVNRQELPSLLRAISSYNGDIITRKALQIGIHCFVRPGELRGARWEEFDLVNKIWRVPAERMKMKEEHLVPLSRQVIELLEELRPVTGKYDLVFAGEVRRTQPISENTMTYALYRMGYKSRATVHGFRATASSILNEEGFNPDAIERQLAHKEKNEIRAAYSHMAEYLKEREKMMQWWADYLEALEKNTNVIPAKFGT